MKKQDNRYKRKRKNVCYLSDIPPPLFDLHTLTSRSGFSCNPMSSLGGIIISHIQVFWPLTLRLSGLCDLAEILLVLMGVHQKAANRISSKLVDE